MPTPPSARLRRVAPSRADRPHPPTRAALLLAFLALVIAAAMPSAASAVVIKRFALGDPEKLDLASSQGLAAGADGNLWFYDSFGGALSRMTPSGSVTQFDVDLGEGDITQLTAGPDGNIWFTATDAGGVGRITPAGAVTLFSKGIRGPGGPLDIAAGPDGNVWFTEPGATRVGRITPAGVVTEFSAGITPHSGMSAITAGADGNVWVAVLADAGQRIARITPAGRITEFSSGLRRNGEISGMTAGPDGNVWFSDDAGAVGKVTPTGKITTWSAGIEPGSEPWTIAAGSDGNVWFTESEVGRLGRVTPAGEITEFSAGLGRNDLINSSITAGPGGRLWFETLGGIASLTPTPGTAVSVVTRRARVDDAGSTSVQVVCGAGTEPCAGRFELTIRTRETVRPGGGQPAFTLPKVVVVGRGRHRLRPGQRRTVKVTMSRSGLRRLARRGRLEVRYRAASSAGDARGGLVLVGRRRGG